MNDLFGENSRIAELEARVAALEALLNHQAKQERVKVEEPLNEAWQVWSRHRNGKGWTAKARELSMRTLRDLAGTDGGLAMSIVEQSIERGWRGLFPLSEMNALRHMDPYNKNNDLQPRPKYKTAAETLIPTETKEQRDAAYLAQQRMYGFIE